MKLSGKSIKNKNQKPKKGEKTMKRILILIFALSLMGVFSYGYFYANWPCILYNGQCPTPNSSQSSVQSLSPSLGKLSIEAAGFFLQSTSDFQAFLKKVELSEIYGANDEELIELITGAIENIQMAHSIYYRVWQMSNNLERNTMVLQKLIQFDYCLFNENKNFIPSIYNEVESYLKKGNMPGAFEKIYNDTGDILQLMESLKTNLEANSIDIPLCWEVNHKLLESELFGQYISQIFSEIKKYIL